MVRDNRSCRRGLEVDIHSFGRLQIVRFFRSFRGLRFCYRDSSLSFICTDQTLSNLFRTSLCSVRYVNVDMAIGDRLVFIARMILNTIVASSSTSITWFPTPTVEN